MRSFVALSLIGLAAAAGKGRQTTEPVYTCPPAFELIGKTCSRQVSTPATHFCASGSLHGDKCLTPAARDASCPPGATPTGQGCSITESVPAERVCPLNTHDIGGECHTYSVTGIVEVCARGQLVGGQCEISEIVPPVGGSSCPQGYEEAKGSCWKNAVMDCSNADAAGKRLLIGKGAGAGGAGGAGVAGGWGAGAGGAGGWGAGAGGAGGAGAGGFGGAGAGAGPGAGAGMGGRGAGFGPGAGMGGLRPATGAPQQIMPAAPLIPAPAYIPLPAKISVSKKQCEVKLEAPLNASIQCPAGSENKNGQCTIKTYEPSTIECSLGQTHLCFPATSSAPLLRCPAGFQASGDNCSKSIHVPKNSFCPAGTIDGGKGACMTATPATAKCAAGLQLSGGMCLGTETVAPTVQVTMTCQGKNCFRH